MRQEKREKGENCCRLHLASAAFGSPDFPSQSFDCFFEERKTTPARRRCKPPTSLSLYVHGYLLISIYPSHHPLKWQALVLYHSRHEQYTRKNSFFSSLGRCNKPGRISPFGSASGGPVQEEVDPVDRGGRGSRHGTIVTLRLVRQILSPNIPQVSSGGVSPHLDDHRFSCLAWGE